MKKYIYIAVLIVCGQKLASQTNCDNFIEEATDLYSSGHYQECITMLENGLNTCSLSKSKKENAYVLLINSNIEKDSLAGIDKNLGHLLMNNPAFNIDEYNGLDDFIKYFKHYYVYPKLSIGLRVPRSFVKIIPQNFYSVIPGADNSAAYIAATDFKFNTFADYRINKKIALFTDVSAFGLSYDRDLISKYCIVYSEEQSTYMQLDFGAKYFFNVPKKINYFMEAGFSNLFLLNSKLTLNRTDIIVKDLYADVDETKYFSENAGINSKKLRNPYVYSLFLGAGAIYRFGPLGVGFDTRVYYSLNTINNISSRFALPELIRDYNYIDNDISMLKFDASIIITYSWFKVERKKTVQ
jgi:hypothetical protein